jgi:hypothetical protein
LIVFITLLLVNTGFTLRSAKKSGEATLSPEQ